MTFQSRTARVSAARMSSWLKRFTAAHGGIADLRDTDDGVRLVMQDGTVALLTAPWSVDGRPGRGKDLVERMISLAAQERRLGIILIRQGSYAAGVSSGEKLLAHKVGTASARSRGADKAAAVLTRAAEQALATFHSQSFEYLGTGGDKALVRGVLAMPEIQRYAKLPLLTPLVVADPNMVVLTKAAADFASIRIRITDALSL